jgi:outer membrane protein assembly factor BamB
MRFSILALLVACGCSGEPSAGTQAPAPAAANGAGGTKDPAPVAATAAGSGDAGSPGSDWPGFLGPLGTSVSTEKGIINPWPKDGLRVVWQMKTGTGYAPVVISRGRLFLFDRHEDKSRLTCMKSTTGEVLWKFEYPSHYKDKYNYNNGPRCCPVVDGDRVYIHGAEGMLHCVRFDDGKRVWKVDEREDFNIIQNFFGVGSTPVIEKDLLIVQVGGSAKNANARDFINLKGNGAGVVAFDKYTGKVKYRITDELASYSSPVLATINGRRWCFVFARGGLIGFEPANGKVDFYFPWRSPELESVNASNPVVVEDKVFISETYGPGSALLRVKPGGYDVLRQESRQFKKSMQTHWMTAIHHDGYLYGSSGRHKENAQLRCVELATGKVMWSVPRMGRASLLMVDGHFVCLSEVGAVILMKVNPQKFEPVSIIHEIREPGKDEQLLEEPCWAAPILAHGLMYLRGEGRLVCLELIPRKK